jgi:hypothetical protein
VALALLLGAGAATLTAWQQAVVAAVFELCLVGSADGERTEVKALMRDYRAWCAEKGFTPIELNALLDEIEKLLRKLCIEIEDGESSEATYRPPPLALRSKYGLVAASRRSPRLSSGSR